MSVEQAADSALVAVEDELGALPPTAAAVRESAAEEPRTNRSVLRRFFTTPGTLVPFLIIVAILILTYGAPLWHLPDPTLIQAADKNLRPSAAHWLGTDGYGRDIWSRLVYGGRPAFDGGLIVVVTSMVLGVPAGLIAGYHGKISEMTLSWVSDLLMSLPAMIILLVLAGVSHQNQNIVLGAMGVLMAPGYYRLTRAATMAVRREAYVDAARVAGISDGRIIFSHIWRVISAPVIIQTALTAGFALGMQAGLQVLGIGDPSEPSWGQLIASSMSLMRTSQAWMIVAPSVLLGLVIAAFAVMGQALGDITGNRSERAKLITRRQRAAIVGDRAANSAAPAPDDDVVVRVSGLTVTYVMAKRRVEVVHGVDFAVRKGQVLGVVGESGSGKSQSVFALLGLLPSNGYAKAREIWIDGRNVVTMSPSARAGLLGRTIGYIPQEPISNLDPAFRIGFQLTEPMRKVLKMSRRQANQHAIELLTKVGIADPARVMRLYPHEISGGMAQRVLIAGAVAGRPKVIVADEPTTALDVTVQAEVLELLRELQQEYGMALIIVTHNFGVVADIADHVAVMQDGVVVEQGPVGDIFRSPGERYTAALIEASTRSETRAGLDREYVATSTAKGAGA